MAIVADTYTYVVGVDTHAATHHYAIIDTARGAQLAHGKFPTSPAGLLRAADWITRRTNPAGVAQVLVSMEGTGSYGAQAAELLAQHGYRVVDAPSPKRDRGSGKNDHIDAITAARSALHKDSDALADRRAGQTRSALQILLTARDSMRRDRTRSKNQLTALLRTHHLGIDARTKITNAQIPQIAAWRRRSSDTTVTRIARAEAHRLATHIRTLDTELATNQNNILALVTELEPSLLDLPGIGPVQRRHRAHRLVPSRTHPHRSRLRENRRRLPPGNLLRQHQRPPTQPHRRQTPQQRPGIHRQHPHETRPNHPRLRQTPHRTRPNQTPHPPLPQALHRPTTLPPPRHPLG